MNREALASRIALRFEGHFVRKYVRSKILNDPVYELVLDQLRETSVPIVDVGCGVGILSFYLREHGVGVPILGIDHDPRKIEEARRHAGADPGLRFEQGDARATLPQGHTVLLLDLLHYFDDEQQGVIIGNAIAAAGAAGKVIIRDAVRDGSWRYRMTYGQEMVARGLRWLRAERLHFPTLETVTRPFRAAGFAEEIRPAWGATPFNNYLFVFSRAASGMTNA